MTLGGVYVPRPISMEHVVDDTTSSTIIPLNPAPVPAPIPEPTVPKTGAERLSELDKRWVPGSPLYDGKIERGIGSPYSKLKPDQKKHYEAVEALVAAEEAAAGAQRDLAAAEEKLVEARRVATATAAD